MVKITTIPAHELGPDLARAWSALQRANGDLASGYFHPEFTRCVASVKPNVEVALIEDLGKVVAFFPFERVSQSLGEPVGGSLSDYHGIVSAGPVAVDPLDILRACNLIAWDFSHLPVSQSLFRGGVRRLVASPRMDLTDGYAVYAERKRASGSDLINRVAYLERRLAREYGPIRYAADEIDHSVLDRVLAWKSAQYVMSGVPDIFRSSATRALLRTVHETRTEGFAGVLSALYAGDRLIAGHFGMRSLSSWHYWFPSYDPNFSKYSPGLILLLKMARSASKLGVRVIDLGAGMADYKARLATGSATLTAGSIELLTWRSVRRGVGRGVAVLLRNSRLEAPARTLVRKWRSFALPES